MDRKLLAAVILFSLVLPLHFIAWTLFPPDGAVFNGYDEGQAIIYSVMKSVNTDFENPWILDGEPVPRYVMSNPSNGPVYTLITIGMVSELLGGSYILVYVSVLFLSGIALFLLIYRIMSFFSGHEREAFIMTALFMFSAGISVYWQLPQLFSGQELSLAGIGVNAFRTAGYYIYIGTAFGMASLYFVFKRNVLISSVLLGMSMLMYPLHGLAAFIVGFLYIAIYYERKFYGIAALMASAAIFSFPWAYFYFLGNTFFTNYYGQNAGFSVSLGSVLIGIGISSAFMLYEIYRSGLAGRKVKTAAAAVSSFLFLLSPLGDERFASLFLAPLVSEYRLFFEMPFVLFMAFMLLDSIKKYRKSEKDFFRIWFFASSLLVFTPSAYTGLFSDRFFIFFYVPAMILAGKGLIRISEFGISSKALLIISIIISLPALVAYNIYFHQSPVHSYLSGGSEFYTESEYNALMFLRSMPEGNIMSSERISMYAPFYTGKKSLLYSDARFVHGMDAKTGDYNKFYSSAGTGEKTAILDRYDIRYVFVSSVENAGNMEFMKKIYDDGETAIYERT